MKSKILRFVFFILIFSSITLEATAQNTEKWQNCYRGSRKPAVVMNYKDVTVPSQNGTPLQSEQVKKAIMQAAADRNWTLTSSGNNKMLATLMVRGKHTISVEIPYGTDKYSLLYKDSTNMNYALCEGESFIHPNYNVWVGALNKAIQSKLAQY